ncbi:hypothetical protein BKA70DRAFT_1418514 [Coprinopsis sp. MPI-PUGE-AT-0042]|nr:hypothetical protein BKA70DRAFT_1418514 [Coprinopsis sp. MPI-PUGE-AT-0042]
MAILALRAGDRNRPGVQVIRALYPVIDFFGGRSNNGLGASLLARRTEDGVEEGSYFYADRFDDRDLFMRFIGGRVGHVATLEATKTFLKDQDGIDKKFYKELEEKGVWEDDKEDIDDV